MSTSNSLVLGNNANVGIGTSSPATKLDINGALTLEEENSVQISSDNQTVTVGNSSYMRLTSNNATAANRTVALSDGLAIGQI